MIRARTQSGQALVEALMGLLMLGTLVVALSWLGRLQDVALQLQHTSRRAAFAWAHQGVVPENLADHVATYFTAPGQRWHTRQGDGLLADGTEDNPLPMSLQLDAQPWATPGGATQQRLMREWRLVTGDDAVQVVRATARTAGTDQGVPTLARLEQHAWQASRYTAILRGDGAAESDAAVQAAIQGSSTAWAGAAAQSRQVGQAVAARVQPLDAAWGRVTPDWDWTSRWAGRVPASVLERRWP